MCPAPSPNTQMLNLSGERTSVALPDELAGAPAELLLGNFAEIFVTTGGAFGGKEDYPEIMGAPLAVAAVKIGKPLRMIFDRFEDLSWTSKRHPSRTRIRTAHDAEGGITAMDYDIIIDVPWEDDRNRREISMSDSESHDSPSRGRKERHP